MCDCEMLTTRKTLQMNAMRLVLLICVASSMLTNDSVAADYAAPIELQLNKDFVNPIGLYYATPTFSWELPQAPGHLAYF